MSDPAPASTSRHAILVGAGILLSRLAGLVRDSVMAHWLGTSMAAASFGAAMRLPNLLQNLLGEGSLSAAFIPVHARLVAEGDEEKAGRVAGAVGALLALVTSLVVLAGIALAPVLVAVLAPGFSEEQASLTVRLVRVIFPGTGLLVMSAWCLGILNSRRRFFLSYVAPVAWNGAMIAVLVLRGGRETMDDLAVLLAWGSVAGALLQLLVQLPRVLALERGLRIGFHRGLPQVREVIRNLGPAIVSRGVVQVSGYADIILASFLPYAAQTALLRAQAAYMLPVSLFGLSISAAELPAMASERGGAEERAAAVRERLRSGLHRVALLVVPTAFAFVFLGRELLAAWLERGAWTVEDTRLTWYVLVPLGVGLLATTRARLYSSAFFALGDTRTSMRFALVRLALSVSLGVALAYPACPLLLAALRWLGAPVPDVEGGEAVVGACGLSIASAGAGWVELALLRRALALRVGPVARDAKGLARIVLASAAGTAAAWAAVALAWPLVLPAVPDGLASAVRALACCLAFGLVYLPLAGVRLRSLRRGA